MPRTKAQNEEIREEKRTLILDTALELFADQGYHRTSINQLAKAAGISQGLLYNYFKNKEAVLYALIIGAMETMMETYLRIKPGQKVTRKDMQFLITMGVDLVLKQPRYWKLYMSVFMQPEVMEKLGQKLLEMSQPYLLAIRNYFRSRGHRKPDVMMRYFSAVMDGVQLHCMVDPAHFPAKEVKKILIEQFA